MSQKTQPAKHLRYFPGHKFQRGVILNAPDNTKIRKNIEASVFALRRRSLNDELDSDRWTLLRHGVM